jgi:DNA-binding transcriptional regulator GbsR (MarR family)
MEEQTVESFVERMGCLMPADGVPRIAGRIFGLLLVSAAERSLDEIAEALQVSKASVSLDARVLERRGVIERVGRPGDRRDYYRISGDLFARIMGQRLDRWRLLHEAVAEARRTIPALAPEARRRLDEIDAGYEFMFAAMQDALARWTDERPRVLAELAARDAV